MGFNGETSGKIRRIENAYILLAGFFLFSACSSAISGDTPEATSTPPDKPIKVQILNDGITEPVIRVDGPVRTDGKQDDGELSVEACWNGSTLFTWAPGHLIQKLQCDGVNVQSIQITLKRIDTSNNQAFPWASAENGCGQCHAELEEWKNSSHAYTFMDRYLESMYIGRNISNNLLGKPTEWIIGNDGKVRLRPASTDPSIYSGPGFRLDYPNENGNCAFCHVPTAVDSSHSNVNLTGYFPGPGGVIGEGIPCDICHRVAGMKLDDKGFPYPDQPGILSFEYPYLQTYPPVYFGPFIAVDKTNIATHENSCLPMLSESSFCGACHYGRFYDMVIYNSYGEWMESKYSWRFVESEGAKIENKNYRSCQDCHMLSMTQQDDTMPSMTQQDDTMPSMTQQDDAIPSGRDACSPKNSEKFDFDHEMMHDENGEHLVRGAASLKLELKYQAETDSLKVFAQVINTKAGHKFPTDSPLRHLILVINVADEQGNSLPQINDERVPAWGGSGNTETTGMTNFANLPGKIFANILMDKDTEESPTVAYWNPTKPLWENVVDGTSSDNRLEPFKPDTSEYSFSLPSRGEVRITGRLYYRFAFIDLALQKGWNRPDILVAEYVCEGPPQEIERMECKASDPLP